MYIANRTVHIMARSSIPAYRTAAAQWGHILRAPQIPQLQTLHLLPMKGQCNVKSQFFNRQNGGRRGWWYFKSHFI